jgi:hypothetical protein
MTVRQKGPCKGCEERKVGCHSECERYKAWLKEYHDEKEWLEGKKHPEIAQYIRDRMLHE